MSNEMIAYVLIGILAVVAVPWIVIAHGRRKRRKARLRGDKRYGH